MFKPLPEKSKTEQKRNHTDTQKPYCHYNTGLKKQKKKTKKTLLSALQSWFKTRDQCLLLPVGPNNLLLSICPSGTTFVKSNQLHLQRDSRKTVSRNNPSAELSPTVFTSQTGQGRNHPSTKSTKTTLRKPGRERKDSETSTNKNKNNHLLLTFPEWVD